MQVIPVVVTPALHAGLVQGELDALRRLFEACAPALVEAADGEVHASQSAAHVTEHLFERAWNQRAEFATADALRDWLVTENHAMALRESSRRIALQS